MTGPVKLRRFPWPLFLGALLLCVLGAVFIASAASFALARRHLVFTALGAFAFILMVLPDYRHYAALAAPLYTLGIVSLIMLRFFGVEINNARRWFSFGPVNLQPSELMKVFLVLSLATYFACRPRLDRLRDLLPPLALTLVPVALIITQPDLGTALVMLLLFFAVAFLAGAPLKNLAVLTGIGLLLTAAAWHTPGMIREYQKQRLTGFINPAANPHSPAAYNARQATLAIAGGGWYGQGWGQGQLTQLRRIPERHTDFIFPVIAEEWGYLRTAAFTAYYFLIGLLLWKMTSDADDFFARLLIGGAGSLFVLQGALHMAISLRLAPITGLTLPLISYGGSSLLATMTALGVAAGAHMRRDNAG